MSIVAEAKWFRLPDNGISETFDSSPAAEVYVYIRGKLIMKRWLETGLSCTFHVAPLGVRWNR